MIETLNPSTTAIASHGSHDSEEGWLCVGQRAEHIDTARFADIISIHAKSIQFELCRVIFGSDGTATTDILRFIEQNSLQIHR